jgi:hypothetical protein
LTAASTPAAAAAALPAGGLGTAAIASLADAELRKLAARGPAFK